MQAEFEKLFQPNPGRTLIVGSKIHKGREDRRVRYADVVGVDIEDGDGVDRVLDLEKPLPRDIGKFAHIECMSVLEHTPKPWLMAANIERLLEPGGSLYVAAPFVWRFHAYSDDYYRFSISGIRYLFGKINFEHLMYASTVLNEGPKVPVIKHKDHPYIARTMTVGFGRKA